MHAGAPGENELIVPALRGRWPATGRRERSLVGARGIEPAVDRLKAGCSVIELYPRWCAAPDSNRETLGFEPSDFTNLPSRASDPARNRTWIWRFGFSDAVHCTTGPEPYRGIKPRFL